MASRDLPTNPSLDQYRKQAKDLLKLARASDAEAIARLQTGTLSALKSNRSQLTLAHAQHVIAREHGYANWADFVAAVESRQPQDPNSAVWSAAENALIRLDEEAFALLLREHGQLLRNEQPPARIPGALRPDYSSGDLQTIFVSNHHLRDWDHYLVFKSELSRHDSPAARFEAAADAVVTGNVAKLRSLLQSDRDLAHSRSMRVHRSTLLHYVGANGIEYYREHTPKNALVVTDMLLEAGAEINSYADMYGGGCTAFGLIATSIFPLRAGLQEPLLKLLMSKGADVGGPEAVNSCLANGRQAAAEFLAMNGAPLDLEGAAGVGRLDLVKTYFKPDGSLTNGATQEQMNRGFAWACEYGRTKVAEFLMDMGMDITAPLRNHGNTGLHWAAVNAHADLTKVLLKRGIPVDTKDATWGNTPLGWALHGWGDPPPGTPRDRYYEVARILVAAGAEVRQEWLEDASVQRDEKMMEALTGIART